MVHVGVTEQEFVDGVGAAVERRQEERRLSERVLGVDRRVVVEQQVDEAGVVPRRRQVQRCRSCKSCDAVAHTRPSKRCNVFAPTVQATDVTPSCLPIQTTRDNVSPSCLQTQIPDATLSCVHFVHQASFTRALPTCV